MGFIKRFFGSVIISAIIGGIATYFVGDMIIAAVAFVLSFLILYFVLLKSNKKYIEAKREEMGRRMDLSYKKAKENEREGEKWMKKTMEKKGLKYSPPK